MYRLSVTTYSKYIAVITKTNGLMQFRESIVV
jgi:hypothetical protein